MIRQALRELIDWAQSGDKELAYGNATVSKRPRRGAISTDDADLSNNKINFAVFPANGGSIVQVYHYDRKKDEEIRTLYVVHDNEEFDQHLAQIISMERLRA
jgi:hypothetical protein